MDDRKMGRLDEKRRPIWAVIGSSGFVGRGVMRALRTIPIGELKTVKAPRLTGGIFIDSHGVLEELYGEPDVEEAVIDLAMTLRGVDVVVNAAGMAAPDAGESPDLYGANTLLPSVLAEAAQRAGVSKLIHISSAAVQGNIKVLDESPHVKPFSPYSRSKALGEQALALWSQRPGISDQTQLQIVIIRATSVQGSGRQTTASLTKVACSPLASVARPGTQPSVVSSLTGLSDFIVCIGMYPKTLPQILIQPWEGVSVRDVMQLAGGGRNPVMLPKSMALIGVRFLKAMGRLHSGFQGMARRLEVMWFGQSQVAGWAVEHGLVGKNDNEPTDTIRHALARDGCTERGN